MQGLKRSSSDSAAGAPSGAKALDRHGQGDALDFRRGGGVRGTSLSSLLAWRGRGDRVVVDRHFPRRA
jgi:hypothetical protein